MARPKHAVTEASRTMVQTLTGMGLREVDIGVVMGISARSVRRHYRRELSRGVLVANSNMAQSLYRKGMGDGPQAVAAAIFWMKTRAGWQEVERRELSGIDGGPIDLRALSTEQIIGLLIEHEGAVRQKATA